MDDAARKEYLMAIEKRISRRTYTTDTISDEKVDMLKRRIEEINKDSGLNFMWIDDAGVAFSAFKSYGFFKNVRAVVVLGGEENIPHLKEKVGYYGEKLMLDAVKLDLGTCWVAGTYNKGDNTITKAYPKKIISLFTVGIVAEEQGFKEKILYKVIRIKRMPLEKFYTADKEISNWFFDGMQAVQKAPSAGNSQRYRFAYQGGRVIASIAGNWATDYIDLGIAKLHFELGANGKFNLGNEAEFIKYH